MRSWARTQLAISRWILRALGLLAGVSVAASAALLHYIVLTPGGLQFVVTHFPQRIGSVTLELSGVTGTLGKEVRIERLDIDHERVHLQLDDIHGSIALPGLLHQSLTVPEVAVRLLTITIKPRLRPSRPSPVHFLPRWLVIRAHRAIVGTLTVILPSGRHVRMTHLGGAGIVRANTIDVIDSYGTLGALSARAKGQVGAGDPLRLRSDGDVTIHFDGQPDWQVQASINGDLAKLPFRGVIKAPMRAIFAGSAYDLTGAWRWTSESDVQEFTLRPWKGGDLLGVITGHVTAEGDSKGFGGHGPLDSSGLHAGLFDAVFHGSYAKGTVTADRMEVTHRASRAHASGTGTITVVDHGPRLDLHGTWNDFRWPLVGTTTAVRSAGGNFHLSGVWPYAVESSGTMSIPLLPWFTDVPVQMTGALDHDHLDVDQAMVSAVSGATEVNGKAYWSPTPHWIAAGTSTGIDAGLIRNDVPGRLNFAFDARGNGFDSTQDFDVNLHSMGGTLRKVAARGEGRFGRHHGDWSFDHVRTNLGGTNIALDGTAGSSLDLRFTLASDDLSLLGVGATGKLSARGAVGGSLKSPHLELSALGSKIAYAGAELQSLQADIDVDAARSGASSARVALRSLSYGKRTLDRLTLALDGTAQQHGIDLKMDAQDLHGEAHAAGSFADGIWRGQLQDVSMKGTDALNLGLEKPVALLASTAAMRIESFCLSGSPAHLCADADWTRAKWAMHLSASDLPMSTLTSGLRHDINYQGTISLAAEGFGGAGQLAQGQLRAELANAQLLHREANKRVTVTTLGSGYVLVQARPEVINGEVSLDAGQVGTIKGHATAQRNAATLAAMPVRGSLQVRTEELGFVTLYLPEIDRAAGNLAADLEVSGTLGDPRLNGTVHLTNAELNLYQVNFSMHQTSFDAQLSDNLLDFTGSAQVGQGHAGARGHLEWHDSLPHGRIELNGENLRVTNIPEAQIDASPTLVFAIDGRRIDVTGRVQVPFAHIQPADLTGAVRTSSDEVIVGADAPASGPPFDVTSDITLALGDKVSIDTSGLTGRLTGNIELRTGTDTITRGTGELQIDEGKYAAYGRKLDIQKGRLIFNGGPVGDPGVDIRAVKQFPENVAGINVRGTLLQPRLSFFSEPSLPQSQIVSLILAGGSFSGEDSTIVSPTHAATGGSERTGNELLAQGGAILAQQLGAQLGLSSRLGIEDVTIESDLNNDTALVLGRYLSPRLYVSYGISLTEALNTVKLRYSLNDHWTIRSEVGGEHSAELVYTIEK